ncbi:zinc-ribbon domain-containing protein [Curtobacterium sp. MCBD17_040]|uniref:zinc-ribbon domain-containing protein n=1 Tax=Curtobacterium sp. MCBD17_040 TaxID=2175674 RepID=UPI000DA7354A
MPSKPNTGCSRADVVTTHPHILAEWDNTANRHLRPLELTAQSDDVASWHCPNGHSYTATIADRCLRGVGCPKCEEVGEGAAAGRPSEGKGSRGPRRPRPGRSLAELHPDLAAQWHPTKNGDLTPADVGASAQIEVWWAASCAHGDWKQLVAKRAEGQGCRDCGRARAGAARRRPKSGQSLADLYPEVAALWDPSKNGELKPSDVAANASAAVWWRADDCEYDHSWQAIVSNKVRSSGTCVFCSNQRVLRGFNDLATTQPHLLAEWDYEANGDLLPVHLVAGSQTPVHWVCSERTPRREHRRRGLTATAPPRHEAETGRMT